MKKYKKKSKPEQVQENYGYPSLLGYTSGGHYNSGLNLMGYQYQLLNIQDYYQQKPNKVSSDVPLHVGSKVFGYTLDKDPVRVSGKIVRIDKNEDGTIKDVYIMQYDPNKEGNKIVKVNPDRLSLNTKVVTKISK